MRRFTNVSKILLYLLLVSICTCFFAFPIFAAGDYIDHGGDWGGSNDFGSSGDTDYSGGGGSYTFFGIGGGSNNGGTSGILGAFGSILVIAILIVIVFYCVFRKHRASGNSGAGYSNSPLQMSDTSNVDVQSLNRLKETDPQFSEAAMLSKAENLFTTMQLAWCDQDYEPVRPFLSNALYEQQAKQIEAKKERDEKNVSSEIAVLQSKLESYSTDGHTEYLNVWLRVKLKDYVVRISNPSVIVTGTPDRVYYLDFRWQFTRSAGAVTNAATDAVKTGECPCCGANININQSGRCEYCGSIISTTEYDWVLSKIDGLQQRSR